MKKLLFFYSLIALIPVYFTSLLFVRTPSIESLSGCFTTNMYNLHICKNSKEYVKLGSISRYLIDSVIISEDAAFYSHNGFDFDEIKQSFKTNMEKKSLARGGSTITQQLSKNIFLSADKTFVRKALEAYFTWRLESNLTKREILELYLNVVEFGPNVFGVRAASRYYFNKSPYNLDLFESAFLAHLLPNPKTYSQHFVRGSLSQFNIKRVRDIARKLLKFKKINIDEYYDLENHFSL